MELLMLMCPIMLYGAKETEDTWNTDSRTVATRMPGGQLSKTSELEFGL